MSNFRNATIAVVAIAVLGTVGTIGVSYWRMSNQAEAVINAGKAIVDGGVVGITDRVEATGEGAATVRESVGAAVDTATKGVDPVAVDKNIDKATNWLGNKVGNLRGALKGEVTEDP